MIRRTFHIKSNHLYESVMYAKYCDFSNWFRNVKIYATNDWIDNVDGEDVFCGTKGCEFTQLSIGNCIDFKAIVDDQVIKLRPTGSSTFTLIGEPINN